MIKLNFNKDFIGLDGKVIEGQGKLSKMIGNMLANSQTGDAVKYLSWGIQLYKDGVLEVDQSDFDAIKSFINDNKTVAVMLKGRLLEIVRESEKEKK